MTTGLSSQAVVKILWHRNAICKCQSQLGAASYAWRPPPLYVCKKILSSPVVECRLKCEKKRRFFCLWGNPRKLPGYRNIGATSEYPKLFGILWLYWSKSGPVGTENWILYQISVERVQVGAFPESFAGRFCCVSYQPQEHRLHQLIARNSRHASLLPKIAWSSRLLQQTMTLQESEGVLPCSLLVMQYILLVMLRPAA